MQKIFIGADHGGFEFKNNLKELLKAKGLEVVDMGAPSYEKEDDYPDYAKRVCTQVLKHGGFGILICRSGHGMNITANKFPGAYASVCWNEKSALKARKDDGVNVLCLPADYMTVEDGARIVDAWLSAPELDTDRYKRRLDKVKQIEKDHMK